MVSIGGSELVWFCSDFAAIIPTDIAVGVRNRWGAVEENGPSIPSLSQLRKLEFPKPNEKVESVTVSIDFSNVSVRNFPFSEFGKPKVSLTEVFTEGKFP